MEPFEDFEFKPLTEGLGFHKKAEKIKHDIKASQLGDAKTARSVPDAPPGAMLKSSATKSGKPTTKHAAKQAITAFDIDGDELDFTTTRPASKSISDLIAALPPSLDFLESDSPKAESAEKEDEDEISVSYPFLRKSKRANVDTKTVTSQGTPAPSDSVGPLSSVDIDTPSRPQIFQPLGRVEYTAPTEKVPLKTPAPGSPAVASKSQGPISAGASSAANAMVNSTANSVASSKIEASYARAFPHVEKEKSKSVERSTDKSTDVAASAFELRKTSAGFAAAILDGLAILGVSTLLLVVVILITKVDLVRILMHPQTGAATQFHLVLLFLCVMQLYVLSARSFFGVTLGEWAFDMQLGTADERKKALYPFRVLWRMVLVLLTGVMLIPLVSMIVGRDLFAAMGGLQLYRYQR